MASLAVLLKQKKHEVWGTDQNVYPPMSDFLKMNEIPFWEGYDPKHLDKSFDLAVIGNALSRGNEEVEALLNRHLPYASLPEIIRREFIQHQRSIVVTGTHGKTTTTSLVCWLLESAGLSPTFLIGGIAQNFQASARVGDGPHFVIEGDEYDTAFFDKRPKFLHYLPHYLIINNIEFDHADIYDNIEQIKDGFRKLIRVIPGEGLILANGDDPQVTETVSRVYSRLLFFGRSPENHWNFSDVQVSPSGTFFNVSRENRLLSRFHIPGVGEFQIYNSLAAIALMVELDLEVELIQQGLDSFGGVKRRMEYWGNLNNAMIYDDFAHHPTAIRNMLQALKKLHPDKRIVAVFEPRTNTSIRNIFQDELANALGEAQVVILLPVHRASSIPENQRLSLDTLQESLTGAGKNVIILRDYPEIHPILNKILTGDDAAILLTNGNLGGEYERLRNKIRKD